MKRYITYSVGALAVLAGMLTAFGASAQPAAPGAKRPPPVEAREKAAEQRAEPADKRAEPADKAADKRAEAADKAADKRAEAAEKRGGPGSGDAGIAEDEEARKNPKVRERVQKLRENRAERRRESQEQVRKKWGDRTLAHPAVQAELKTHAWRMARLERMRLLAESSDHPQKDKRLERIKALTDKELARHEKRMAELQKQAGGAPAADAGAGAVKTADAGAAPAAEGGAR
jgi:hypothetical protein